MDQIKYIAVIDKDVSNNQFKKLTLQQVSGELYILYNIEVKPIYEKENGLLLEGDPISFNILEHLQAESNLPHYVIPEIGELICYKQPTHDDKKCKPSDISGIKFRYTIFDKIRDYQTAIIRQR